MSINSFYLRLSSYQQDAMGRIINALTSSTVIEIAFRQLPYFQIATHQSLDLHTNAANKFCIFQSTAKAASLPCPSCAENIFHMHHTPRKARERENAYPGSL